MDWQSVAAGALVAGSMVWSTWTLMPGALRARCRRLFGAAPAADSASACGGCGGCGGNAPKPDAEQVVRIVRRVDGG